MRRQIVHDDDVAGREFWGKDLLQVNAEYSLKIANVVSLNAPPTCSCSNHRVMSAMAILLW